MALIYDVIINNMPIKLFKNKKENEECALSIYLVALGIRPASIPFDGSKTMSSFKMYDIIVKNDLLRNLQLKTKEYLIFMDGPYYDCGNSIVICNKSMFSKTKIILDKIKEKRINDDSNVHILMAQLLGYTNPIDLNKLKRGTQLYTIKFATSEKDSRELMAYWIIKNDTLNSTTTYKKCFDKLDEINKGLRLINKVANLTITDEVL